MRDVFNVRWFFPPPSSHSTTPHSTTDTPFTQGRLFAGKMQRQFANFLASGKNYFHTISCLLINQAHISKGVRVESCTASLQGVLEICRPNAPLSPQTNNPHFGFIVSSCDTRGLDFDHFPLKFGHFSGILQKIRDIRSRKIPEK